MSRAAAAARRLVPCRRRGAALGYPRDQSVHPYTSLGFSLPVPAGRKRGITAHLTPDDAFAVHETLGEGHEYEIVAADGTTITITPAAANDIAPQAVGRSDACAPTTEGGQHADSATVPVTGLRP
ncbi:hypothetical protein [Kitasatospora sp. NPDC088783]|uniref:hypothetical protein n=1 Tax=Kitasatospora sp. NPDC088783 TaxID=3364077 RepID=UPI00380505B2